ncbi:hypothetical protein GUJ93_ZPchr0001g33034 [Zizania palustris]|uniref:Uncharacterized protein n=1 Tax=Zizania palustris TaxID=103762 RepID=A0A8J5S8N3_ZIZPA|nr:hypothetical protein GUJ93_ZPchr0124g11323 [Zizania palustris]KAG8052176.1 hypothetical protein GUJ93_ZPchr0001g33034 [Zizania palustris]
MAGSSSSGRAAVLGAGLVLSLILAAGAVACHGARAMPGEQAAGAETYRPQNVFGFGGFYPGPSVNWVFPGPNGVTPQVGFGGMPGSSSSVLPGGGGGVIGIHSDAKP